MKIGDVVKIKGYDCVVMDIDETSDEVFLWCKTDKYTVFGYNNNIYEGSELKEFCNIFAQELDLPFIEYNISCNPIDNISGKSLTGIKIAPLSLDIYRKYSEIIKPYIKEAFWLCSPWYSDNETFACIVDSDGLPSDDGCSASCGFAPAFKLPLSYLIKMQKEKNLIIDLSSIPMESLLAEIAKRTRNI